MCQRWQRQSALFLILLCCITCYGNDSHNADTRIPNHLAMQDLLGESGRMLYIEKPWSTNERVDPSGGISTTCKNLLLAFSNATTTYLKCIMCNARPLHYCENCVGEFAEIINSYNGIVKDNENGTTCEDQLLRADNVQVVLLVYKFALQIWDKSACHNCYKASIKNGTTVYSPTQETTHMLDKIQDVQGCFHDFGKDPVKNVTVCTLCKEFYNSANDYYHMLDDEGDLCSDLEDSMNYTRRMWSKEFHCTVAIHTDLVIYCMCAAVGLIPVIFYVSLYVNGKGIRITTDRRRRSSSAAGLTDNADPLDIQASTSDAISS